MGGILDGFIQPIKPPGLEGHLPEFRQAYLAPHKGVAGVCNRPTPIAIERRFLRATQKRRGLASPFSNASHPSVHHSRWLSHPATVPCELPSLAATSIRRRRCDVANLPGRPSPAHWKDARLSVGDGLHTCFAGQKNPSARGGQRGSSRRRHATYQAIACIIRFV